MSKCRRFWKVLISAIHKAEEQGPPLLGRLLGAGAGVLASGGGRARQSARAVQRPAEAERRVLPGHLSCSRRGPRVPGGARPAECPCVCPSDRSAVGPAAGARGGGSGREGAARRQPEDADPDPRRRRTASRPCRWWGWTWAPRAATSRWPGPGASRPSPTNSATGAPRKWEFAGRWGQVLGLESAGDPELAGRWRRRGEWRAPRGGWEGV